MYSSKRTLKLQQNIVSLINSLDYIQIRGLYVRVTHIVSLVLAGSGTNISSLLPFSTLPDVPTGQEHSSPLFLKLHDLDMFSYLILKLLEPLLSFLPLKLLDLDPFSLFLLLADLWTYLLSLELALLILGLFWIDSALNDRPATPTIVPDDDRLSRALVMAETSALLRGMSKEPPQLVQSTEGPRNHCDLVFILSVCRS